MQHLVVFKGLVIDLDAAFLLEIGDHVFADVVGPVVDVQHFFFAGAADRAGGIVSRRRLAAFLAAGVQQSHGASQRQVD